jgi:hypothetical protein
MMRTCRGARARVTPDSIARRRRLCLRANQADLVDEAHEILLPAVGEVGPADEQRRGNLIPQIAVPCL